MIRSSICRKTPFAFPWQWFRFSHFKPTLPFDSDVRFSFPPSYYYYYSSSATSRKSCHPVADYLIDRHQFSIAVALKVFNRISLSDNYEESTDSNLSWLKDIGLSQSQIESVVSRTPRVLLTDLDRTLKPKYKVFKDLGFKTDDFVEIVVLDPWLLINRAANRIYTSIVALKTVLGSVEDILRLLKKCTWFLKTDLDKNLLVNIDFLQKECWVRPLQIRRFLFNFPRLFLKQPKFIKSIVQRIDEMNFGDRNSGMFLHAVRAMSSMTREKWEAKLKLFRSLGLSEEEISRIFRSSPQVLATSDRKIKEVIDLLNVSEKSGMSIIVRHPSLLLFSVEQRIKPRMLVLDVLVANKLIQRRPSLAVLCKLSNRDFSGKYVIPYSDKISKTFLLDKVQ